MNRKIRMNQNGDRHVSQPQRKRCRYELRRHLHRPLHRITTLGAIALCTCLITLGQACQNPNLLASPDSPNAAELEAQCDSRSDFAWVPPGTFTAGSDAAERDAAYRMSAEGWAEVSAAASSSNESPVTVATAEQNLRQRRWFDREPEQEARSLSGFCIRRNLITNADYLAFVNATGHRSPDISAAEYQEQGFLVHPYEDVEPYRWQSQPQPAFPEGKAQHPVVLVSYDDAIAYAQWRGEQDSVSYRLPTALEWEKAARGTDRRYFPWGDEWQNNATNWIGRKHFGDGLEGTSAIATYPLSRSVYGVEDMSGNVFEYTSTLLERGDRPVSVMKGCSWDDLPGFCRAAYRHTRPTDSRHILFGFRLALE
ncbi:MAG: SUMF1/EgtB/PvdO family nonheme iron enzyme [Elainellaceae cyanobacterium]